MYRYVNQTDYEAVLPALGAAPLPKRDKYGGAHTPCCVYQDRLWFSLPCVHCAGRSTATTPLGHLLAFGTHHAAGNTGPVPSGTSRFYSVDLGLVHFIALDLNMYACESSPAVSQRHICWSDTLPAASNGRV